MVLNAFFAGSYATTDVGKPVPAIFLLMVQGKFTRIYSQVFRSTRSVNLYASDFYHGFGAMAFHNFI